jgi:6-phosphogluconolactonase
VNYNKDTDSFKIYRSADLLAEAMAEELLKLSFLSDSQTPISICLSGGKTPKILFQILARDEYLNSINWANLSFWWGDERWVPSSDSESNFGEAYRILFHKDPCQNSQLHPYQTDLPPQEGLKHFLNELNLLPQRNSFPIFDLIILGLGEDGHTASLFPPEYHQDLNQAALLCTNPYTGQQRISLSLKCLTAAERIIFLVSGKSKAPIIQAICENDSISHHWPATKVYNYQGKREWYTDTNAIPEKDSHGK